MDPTIDEDDDRKETKGRETSPLRRLLHRWFIEYNPLYLVSALSVLAGLTLIAKHTSESTSMVVQAGAVAGISEVYAWALIAGAALLTRLGLRRPAVMLCLVTALYQGDLTLLTERQVYLGLAGAMAVTVWLATFVAKLYAVAWAMRLRLSRSAVGVPAFGAFGMAMMPRVLQHGDSSSKTAIVAIWVFSLFAAGLWTSREVTSEASLDTWGRTVLGRALKATWLLWAALVIMHVLFWCHELGASPAALVPVGFLLATRWMRGEASVWAAVTGAVLYAGAVEPRSLWVVCLLSAATLGLRALRRPAKIEHGAGAPPDATPYRASGAEALPPQVSFGFTRSDRSSMLRLMTGSIVAVYLSAWTFGWAGGALPHHVMLLDASFVAAAVLMVWRARSKAIVAPLALTWLHAGVQAGMISAPSSGLQWGLTAVLSGFVLLLGSLVIAWRLRAEAEPL